MTVVQMIALAIGAVMIVWLVIKYRTHDVTKLRKQELAIDNAGYVQKQVLLPDGAHLTYWEGPSAGLPLVLIPSGAPDAIDNTRFEYREVLEQLSRTYHVFAMDRFGSAQSMAAQSADLTCSYEMKAYAWFITACVDEAAVVSGWADGSSVAAMLAAEQPKCVRALVLETTSKPGVGRAQWNERNMNKIHHAITCPTVCLEPVDVQQPEQPCAAKSIRGAHEIPVKRCEVSAHDEQPGIYLAAIDAVVEQAR